MKNVLYINFAATNFDGATYSLMDLISSVRQWVNPFVLLRSEGCVADYFRQHGVECIICNFEENLVGIPRKPHQFVRYAIDYFPHKARYNRTNAACIKYVEEQLRNKTIDIVHTNNTVISFGAELAQKLHAKHVWHLRGFMDLALGWMPLTGWRDFKSLMGQADATIGISRAVLDHYLSPGASNTYVIFDAVRSEKEVGKVLFPKEKYFLFCAGLLSDQKGCRFAIKAFARSGMAFSGYRLRIIGDCNERYAQKLRRLVREEKVADKVDFIGRSQNVREHMERATAFLMCSENEGLGRVSIEAMFYGCLVLGRNSGGTKEFVLDGETGYIFNDVDECARLINDLKERDVKDIIDRAQRFACENFSIERYGDKIMSIYNNI